ncbi:hypothetical protein LZ634_21130 [Kluyvera intermedia]|uniref:Na+/H+ antiporter NhaC family protein n=1 Tax=Kluyvera intermedia TaxID=61648 RepID=UPI001F23C27B|nr:Na+/H+ antiporter NhaC family protein [Kluyvera intermedia]EKU4734390.1 hypothetical protein [Kluyvera ascorbata]MCE9891179.1 hypothetical protein [Kluyvera intermedia]
MNTSGKLLLFYGGRASSIFPTLIYVAGSVILSVGFHFSSMKTLTFSAMIGILLGFFLCKDKKGYWDVVVRGLMPFGNARLIIAFMLIGIFTTLLMAGKIGGGFVWLCLHIGVGSHAFVLFVFIASAVISMGTCAPIAALFSVVPIFYPPGILLAVRPELLAGAMLSGVFFGDALSPCSQLTQMTLFSQHDTPNSEPGQLNVLLKNRFKSVLATGVVSIVLFMLVPAGEHANLQQAVNINQFADINGIWMLLPLGVLLACGFRTQNLFLSLNFAIAAGLIVGLLCGSFDYQQIITLDNQTMMLHGMIFDGVNSMTDIIVSTLLLYGLINLAQEGGCITALCDWLASCAFFRSRWGAELAMTSGIAVTNIALSGSPMPSILMFSPVAERLGQRARVSALRRCWLLLGGASCFTAIIPVNSVFMMGMVTLIQGMTQHYPWLPTIDPFYSFAFSFYCLLLTLACVIRLLLDSPLLMQKKIKYS